ncbi:MAG: hypothetical protein QN721_03825 [Nitrososphaeraceae archaeon]|nr:hypothetical protein [Nitrososphaeraceae archaeon]MDW0277210.1 hypothetical protein [Nitrososphaeraceae archaeon]MDW0291980.1 hypothetical protein [Nitrososphaeraceae archaeon]
MALCKLKVPFLLITISTTVLLVILISTSNQVFSQSTGGVVSPPQMQLESVKILNLIPLQNVDLKKELVISGESSDTAAKDCSVHVLVNGVQPYQSAVASGTGGATDFSQWKFVLHEQYTHLNEGNNKITAKLVCKSAPTRWSSVVVNGVPNSNISETAPIDTTQQSNVSETAPIETTQQSKLLVTILPLKNPVARGDSQNATITVTNSENRPIANAQIDGKLIYPGNNFEKEFKGSTDLDGKFVYSWTVGKKGDVGPLVMEVEASSQGYRPTSANISFELVKSGESSQIENPFQSLQRP